MEEEKIDMENQDSLKRYLDQIEAEYPQEANDVCQPPDLLLKTYSSD